MIEWAAYVVKGLVPSFSYRRVFDLSISYSSSFATFTELAQIVNISRSINILGAVSDIGIAAVLIFLLQRSRTGFRRSETIINRLIIFTINTGLLTSLCALMSLITVCTFYKNISTC